jgi:hypothetical protein
MTFSSNSGDGTFPASRAAAVIWIALLASLSIGGSFAFACAAPLAAIAALAATQMDVRSGSALVAAAWLTNQIVGYWFLGYPQTVESYAWGAAIGIAALAAFAAGRLAAGSVPFWPATLVTSFLAAFVAYELSLVVAGIPLGSSEEAFSAPVIARIFAINAAAFAALTVLSVVAGYVLRSTRITGGALPTSNAR